jgi:hypothetical protein
VKGYCRREKKKHGDVGMVGQGNWIGVKRGQGKEERKWGRQVPARERVWGLGFRGKKKGNGEGKVPA